MLHWLTYKLVRVVGVPEETFTNCCSRLLPAAVGPSAESQPWRQPRISFQSKKPIATIWQYFGFKLSCNTKPGNVDKAKGVVCLTEKILRGSLWPAALHLATSRFIAPTE